MIRKTRQQTVNYLLLLAWILYVPVSVLGKCSNCPNQNTSNLSTAELEAIAQKDYISLNKVMHDTTFDNPKDSTTERTTRLENQFMAPPQDSIWKYYLGVILLDRLRNDPYPSVRYVAVNYLLQVSLPDSVYYNALTNALQDPCILVKVSAASNLLSFCQSKGKMQIPMVKRIVREAAMGKDRSIWNVKGFGRNESDGAIKDSMLIEKWKDTVQKIAMFHLEAYLGNMGKIYNFLDSISKNGESTELRITAKHGHDIFGKW